MLKKLLKELKTAISIWLVIMIPYIILIAFHKDIAATIWIAIASAIGGIYVHHKDTKPKNRSRK